VRFYYVNSYDVTEFCEDARYFKTLKEAKAEAHRVAKEGERDVEVERVNHGNSYSDVLRMLNYHCQGEVSEGVVYIAKYKAEAEQCQ